MATPNERVAAIEEWSKLKPADFARRTGIQPGTLSKAKKGPFAPSAATVNKILAAYPQINPAWLLHGKGEMLTNAATLPADPQQATPTAGTLAVVPETALEKQLKEENKMLREQLALWQRIATSGVDLSKVLGTGTDGVSFLEGNHSSAEDQAPQMWVNRPEPIAA